MDNKTSLVIAHRLTTVEKCNRIAVIENGQVVEDGEFQTLIEGGGNFAKLAKGMGQAEAKETAKTEN
jgi:ABC-type multidrug transport system fused ATPase/permease subunit